MRILVITQHWYPDSFGGAEYVASSQARLLALRGHEITVITEKVTDSQASKSVEQGITIYRYGNEKMFNRFGGASRAAIAEVSKVLKEIASTRAFDIAILHNPFPAYGFFRVKLNIPTLYVFHASTAKEVMIDNVRRPWILKWFFSKWTRYVERVVLCKASRVGVFSDFSQQILLNIAPGTKNKIVKLQVGVDLEKFNEKSEKKVGSKILTVRRLWPRMGLLELLQAMKIVIKQISDARLIIVGDGPVRGTLEREISHQGLREHIILAGKVTTDDLPRYYQEADLFVLPTQAYEGLGIATLEALASGVPVIGTPVGATPEILGDLFSALITKSASAPDIAQGILQFFARPEKERVTLSKKARELIKQNYNWDKAIDGLEQVVGAL